MAFSDFVGKGDLFQNELGEYLQCELPGHDPLNPCERSFETVLSRALIVLSYGFHGLLPVVNLIFTISVQDMKNKWNALCGGKVKNYSTGNTKNTGSSTVESREMS